MRIRGGIIGLASLLLAGGALGGPFDPRRVPEDAAWLLHVDVERVRGSALADPLLSLAPRHTHRVMTRILEGLRLDASNDLRGLTIYSHEGSESVVILAEVALGEHLAGPIESPTLPDYAFDVIQGLPVHSWKARQTRWSAALIETGFASSPRTVIITSSPERVLRAAAMYACPRVRHPAEGSKPWATIPVRYEPREESVAYLRIDARKFHSPEDGVFHSDLFTNSSLITLDIGLAGRTPEALPSAGVVYAEGFVWTDSAEVAGQWDRALQALLGLGQNLGQAEAWSHAARTSSVWVEGACVRLSFRQDLDRVANQVGSGDTDDGAKTTSRPVTTGRRGSEVMADGGVREER